MQLTEPTTAPEEGLSLPLRQALLRSAAQFSVATVASQASGLLRAWFVGRALGPAAAGIWIGLQLIVAYGVNASLGVTFGMHRHVPLLRGRGEEAAAEEVKQTAFTFSLIASTVLATAAVLAAFGMLAPLEGIVPERVRIALLMLRAPDQRVIVLGIAATLFANLLKSYYVTLFKAENRFREATIGSLLGSAAGVVTLPLIWRGGLAGVVWGLFAMVATETLFLALRAGRPRLGLSRRVLVAQLAVGLITVAITVATTFLISLDRTVLFERFNATQRGYYYPALLAATFFYGLAAVPNAILYPRLSERFGRTGRPSDLAALVEGPLRVVSAGFAVVVGLAFIGLPALVRVALPSFTPGVDASRIALFGTYFYVVVGVAANCFYALNRQWLYLGILLGTSLATYALAHLFVASYPGLPAVAAGVSTGFLLYVVAVIFTTWLIMERRLREALTALGHVLVPITYAAACCAVVEMCVLRQFAPASLIGAVLGGALFMALAVPYALVVKGRAGK